MYDDICACSELHDHCFKKAEQARDLHFSAFIIIFSIYPGLLNLKECVISRQSHIRDDIHRIGVDLERLHNEIERNVARNTVCFRRSGTS